MVGRLVLAASLLMAVGLGGCGGNKAQVADASVGGTIPCTSAKNCPKELPMCASTTIGMSGASGVCVGCLPDFQTCTGNTYCDSLTYTCLPNPDGGRPCHQAADCPRPNIDPSTAVSCEVDSGLCVGCSGNDDCPTDPTLTDPYLCLLATHVCGDPCTLCTAGQVCDLSSCHNDHYCGTADKICHNPDGG